MSLRWVSYFLVFILLLAGSILLALAPDALSLLALALMFFLILAGGFIGLLPLFRYAQSFRTARDNIDRASEVQSASLWLTLLKEEHFFANSTLDDLFEDYKYKVQAQRKADTFVSDIDQYINEEILAELSWYNVIRQLPGTLTGIGLLGTFIGLLTGIGNIGFSSVEAAVSSIQNLLEGIQLAFYTSIAGVILSILFNLFLEFTWNMTVRELKLFLTDFHNSVLPSDEEQAAQYQHKTFALILEKLDRLPKNAGFSLNQVTKGTAVADQSNEKILMPQILSGLQNGEFTFYLQPRYDLNTKKIIGGEALMRWNHSKMGMVSPGVFIPILESNGYITKVDQYVWEKVCATIRKWVDEGIRPVPVAVNISKTDILASDIVDFFTRMLKKYRIPPRLLELEITESAYLTTHGEISKIELALRQQGFRVTVDGFDGDFFTLDSIVGGFTADAVKLDLRGVLNSKGSEVIPAIISHAQQQKINISVEGIENMEQLSQLRKSGCSEGQGYYLSKPMPIEKFEAMITQAPATK